MNKIWFTVALVLVISFNTCFSQTSELDSIFDMLLFEEVTTPTAAKDIKYQFLYASIDMSNKTVFAGRESGVEGLFDAAGQISWFHSSGFSAGIAGIWYNKIAPNYNTTILSLGYSKQLKSSKKISYRFGLNRFISSDKSYSGKYNNSFGTGFTYRRSRVGMRFDISVPFGKEVTSSYSYDIYSKFKLVDKNNWDITLQPEFSVYFSKETFWMIDSNVNITEEYYQSEKFGLMNSYVKLPLDLTIGDFDLGFTYYYNMPTTNSNIDTYENNSFFNISLGYMFELK